ncbi:uncharacterized protein LOC128337527 isoform X1 [Hemicordylus capensis]|uniref:uncharacterized protein LOC128337527 isoform X1 n=1 Tax=Hemicordylus capensis TaxID=884348 RepID=UPI0023048AB9|nr:uncharacterized protein LOC128337527 isoform X1 [Hemicordylus capensis]XP_053134599.1 uncharacterized protein LOC128337527 isoform X1 [Hemicordylus capensis]
MAGPRVWLAPSENHPPIACPPSSPDRVRGEAKSIWGGKQELLLPTPWSPFLPPLPAAALTTLLRGHFPLQRREARESGRPPPPECCAAASCCCSPALAEESSHQPDPPLRRNTRKSFQQQQRRQPPAPPLRLEAATEEGRGNGGSESAQAGLAAARLVGPAISLSLFFLRSSPPLPLPPLSSASQCAGLDPPAFLLLLLLRPCCLLVPAPKSTPPPGPSSIPSSSRSLAEPSRPRTRTHTHRVTHPSRKAWPPLWGEICPLGAGWGLLIGIGSAGRQCGCCSGARPPSPAGRRGRSRDRVGGWGGGEISGESVCVCCKQPDAFFHGRAAPFLPQAGKIPGSSRLLLRTGREAGGRGEIRLLPFAAAANSPMGRKGAAPYLLLRMPASRGKGGPGGRSRVSTFAEAAAGSWALGLRGKEEPPELAGQRHPLAHPDAPLMLGLGRCGGG